MAPRQRVLEGAHVHIVMTINSSVVKNCGYIRDKSDSMDKVTMGVYYISYTAQLPIKMDSCDSPEIELATCKFSL